MLTHLTILLNLANDPSLWPLGNSFCLTNQRNYMTYDRVILGVKKLLSAWR